MRQRIVDPALGHPFDGGARVEQGFSGSEGLGGNRDQRRRWIEAVERLGQRRAIDVGDDGDIEAVAVASQCIDNQIRPQRRSTNADMDDVCDRPEHIGVDRIDQRPHPGVECARQRHALLIAYATLGSMFGRAPLGDIDGLSREQSGACLVQPRRIGQRAECAKQLLVEVGLGPVEADTRHTPHQPLDPRLTLRLDQIADGGRGAQFLDGGPGGFGRWHRYFS